MSNTLPTVVVLDAAQQRAACPGLEPGPLCPHVALAALAGSSIPGVSCNLPYRVTFDRQTIIQCGCSTKASQAYAALAINPFTPDICGLGSSKPKQEKQDTIR